MAIVGVYKIEMLLFVVTDIERPVISNLPASINVNTDAGLPTATVPWASPTTTDNSDEPISLTSDYDPGASFPIGTTTVTYTAKDIHGNTATATVEVVVTGKSDTSMFISFLFIKMLLHYSVFRFPFESDVTLNTLPVFLILFRKS